MTEADEAYTAYRAPPKAPSLTLAWNVYGKGVESVGRDGRPELVDVPQPADDQILVRVDAVGLCFSDVKLIRLGGEHPKLYGQNLATQPTRLGHETAVTVVAVGAELAKRFHPGQRLAIQPDIYANGRSTAYGYTIPGGLIGYHVLGPEVLAADDGAYVTDVGDRLGYAETALTEPWACVEAAYTQRRRLTPAPGGHAWVIGRPDDGRAYEFGTALAKSRDIVLSGLRDDVAAAVRSSAPNATISVVDEAAVRGPFDDIIVLGPKSAALVSRASDALAFRGLLNLVGDEPLDGPVDIDIGRIHYHYTAYVGTRGPDVSASYGETRNRAELRSGGVALFVGAAGPMGQMHLERALKMQDGPATLVGVDLDRDRLATARNRLEPIAAALGRRLVLTTTASEEDLAMLVARETNGRGADDVIVTAPTAAAVTQAARVMAGDAMLVLFAGLPVGTRATVDISRVYLHGAQYTGTSGSRIADQALVVAKTLAGELAPARAVAAVGGIDAAADGLRALVEGRFAGKIVIFPQLRGLPLTSLEDLATDDPELAAALGPGGTWNSEAEAVLFAKHLEPTAIAST
ncbi:MAG TPA: alcohol dehydrogenase catalytic domain-containing protein [Candidatus Limnocylindria bacterium]|nr:alcohol dehydrogenase catalytic domain-containing protein [Candidatus Limnocylindria bacterium]